MRQVLVDPFWRLLLAVTLLVGLVAPAVALPIVMLTTNPVEAASLVNITQPLPGNEECVPPGDCVHLCWNFTCEDANCTPIENFQVWIGNDTLDIVVASYAVGNITCTTPINYSVCRCVYLPLTTPDGVYNIRVASTCGTCALDDVNGTVIVDSIDPVVNVTAPTRGDCWKVGVNGTINWTISGEQCLNQVVIEYNNGSGWTHLYTDPDPNPSGGSYNFLVNSSLQSCNTTFRVTAEDCCDNLGSDTSDGITVDGTSPTVSNVQVSGQVTSSTCANDTCLVGCNDVNITFDYSDNCGPLTANLTYKACNGAWVVINPALALAGTSGSAVVPWHVPPTLDCCDWDGGIQFNVNVTDCAGNWDLNSTNTCVVAPLMMLDAITGWAWHWKDGTPFNANARNVIMVTFNKPLELDGEDDCGKVTISDFQVSGKVITDIEIHKDPGISGRNGGAWQGYTYVFLYLASPLLATDAKPTVTLVGCVSAEDEGIEPLQGPERLIAQDGIAPILTVTANDKDPIKPGTQYAEYGELMTVTVTSSECLSEAYLFVGKGTPDDYCWNECKPIGWPTNWWKQVNWGPIPIGDPLRADIWDNQSCCTRRSCGNWTAMVPSRDLTCVNGSKTWTLTFRVPFNPGQDWFIEVAGHDFSHWLPDYPWKHEKWTEESLIISGADVYFVDLCEGWNLVSVPYKLLDPTPAGAFGPAGGPGNLGYSGITKAHYYTGGQFGTWQSTALNPTTGLWAGSLMSIEPAKAYWVWVSPPWMEWRILAAEPDPLSVPPTLQLKKGYNMIGYMELADWQGTGGEGDQDEVDDASNDQDMRFYFSSLRNIATHAYAYDPCWLWYEPDDGGPRAEGGWIRFNNGAAEHWNWHYREMRIGCGYWLFVTQDVLFGP